MTTRQPHTKEEMREAFEAVRESGMTNMFNVPRVIEIAEELKDVIMTKEDVLEIMNNY